MLALDEVNGNYNMSYHPKLHSITKQSDFTFCEIPKVKNQRKQDENESPPLWSNNVRSNGVCKSSATTKMEQARNELMEMFDDLPESCYELSLKDIVTKDTKPELKGNKKGEKKGSISRSVSLDTGVFLLKMFVPSSFGMKKQKVCRSTSMNDSKKRLGDTKQWKTWFFVDNKSVLVILVGFVSSNAIQSDIDCLRSIKNTLQDPENLLSSWDFKNRLIGQARRGLGKISKQNGVKNLIQNENLSICDVLETRLKGEKNQVQETIGKLRRKLWVDLSNYKSISNNNPWVILGDFNVCLNIDDHSEGMSHSTQDMEDFQDCVNNLKIKDIGGAHVVFLPYGISDHSLVVLTVSKALKANKKSFRFTNYITDKEDFCQLSKENWNDDIEVKRLKWDLDEIQLKIDKNPHDKLLRENVVASLKDYSIALEDEEKLMFQRAKVNWLNDGDKNSAFFHKIIKSRMNRNIVDEIWGADNVRYHGDQVPIQFVSHFKSFLGIQNDKECLDLDPSIFLNKINPQDVYAMVGDVSNDEIKAAMFSIDDNKAPGPDGYTTKFYKKAWHIIGTDVCNAVKEFFVKGKLLGELNATLITLVPKVSTPCKVTNFRPIACCNVVYKCISKIITNKIKDVLDSIVNKNQSAFIPERQITDNILLTQELLKGYDCTKGPKRCFMKIDIQKAYDTVDWRFLEKTLSMFGFHQRMVKWIMTYVTTPSYSICVNGERHGYFKGGTGLRQGDPMSPYLFTIVMEIFTLIFQQKISENGNFKYHHGCSILKITHLCFADDLLVMCHGDVGSVKVVKSALDEFSCASGLYLNLGKSTIFCGSMDRVTIDNILVFLPFKRGKLTVRYLGVPLVAKKIRIKDCKSLIDKVKTRIHDWKNKSLSYARRTQLIASVLASIQVYWASVFKLPKTVTKDIERIFKAFLWNHGEL
ncbi:RNA-directed DNA polymerase, eukaryota, reverse transcriptase zinc-binding domain protein [Tanacetum coccineum]